MVILAVRSRRQHLQRGERARRGGGRDLARVDEQNLPDLQRHVKRQSVQRQNAFDAHAVDLANQSQVLVRPDGMRYFPVRSGRAGAEVSHRGGRLVARRVGVGDYQQLPDL